MMHPRYAIAAIISEVGLWGLALLIVMLGVRWMMAHPVVGGQRAGQEITLDFKDVNQLTVGSPVRFMGTDIGFVTRVVPQGTHVQVSLKTYDGSVLIPQGAHFTIEFNGLAGAKTLEVLPPNERDPAPGRGYDVDQPIRVRDVMNTQMALAQALEFSSKNLAHSLGQMDDPRILMGHLVGANQTLTDINRTLVYSLESVRHETQRIHNTLTNATQSIQSFSTAFRKLENVTNPAFFKTQAMAQVRYMGAATEDIYHVFTNAHSSAVVAGSDRNVLKARGKMVALHSRICYQLPGQLAKWEQANARLAGVEQTLCRASQTLAEHPVRPWLENLSKQVKAWSGASRRWAVPPKTTP